MKSGTRERESDGYNNPSDFFLKFLLFLRLLGSLQLPQRRLHLTSMRGVDQAAEGAVAHGRASREKQGLLCGREEGALGRWMESGAVSETCL